MNIRDPQALIEIFDHIYGFKASYAGPGFDYDIAWDIDSTHTRVTWHERQLAVTVDGRAYKTLKLAKFPANIIVYYSGQNDTVSELIRRYRDSYRRTIRKANVADIPRFIGIGPDYKAMLLALMLMLPDDTRARQLLCAKLGIEGVGGTTWLLLHRPSVSSKKRIYDPFENDQLFWGVLGIARDFLDRLMDCIVGEFTPGSLYNRDSDTYRLEINVEKFREIFADTPPDEVFCLFNALHSLDMIEDVAIPVRLAGKVEVTSRAFSDGQFQSIYLFAISELFKNRECLTLLDEPDAFLHPEWQYDFLNHVLAISEEAARTNHILMSSHSASTVAANVQSRLRVFEVHGHTVTPASREKSEIIESLSAGVMTFSEEELRLSIDQTLRDHDCPVLFTEGPTDRLILERGWECLFPDRPMPFAIESGFGRQFLRTLFKDQVFQATHNDRLLLALFDFDEAYEDWRQLGDLVQANPDLCLARCRNGSRHFAILLPTPTTPEIRNQVINQTTGGDFGRNSLLTIEHLFFHCPEVRPLFRATENRPGNLVEFPSGRKTNFAKTTIQALAPGQFDNLRPIFEFIEAQVTDLAGVAVE